MRKNPVFASIQKKKKNAHVTVYWIRTSVLKGKLSNIRPVCINQTTLLRRTEDSSVGRSTDWCVCVCRWSWASWSLLPSSCWSTRPEQRCPTFPSRKTPIRAWRTASTTCRSLTTSPWYGWSIKHAWSVLTCLRRRSDRWCSETVNLYMSVCFLIAQSHWYRLTDWVPTPFGIWFK